MKKHRLLYIPIGILFLLSFVDCAKRGTPTGGKLDSIPPVIVKSSPENYSTNFTGTEFRIYFNEYVKFQDLNTELLISPPMKYAPNITPLSTGKYIKVKILDTLRENTTYAFNFGKSIIDNNEGNEFDYFKYVFSTGEYIDSLKVTGTIRDIQLVNPEPPISIMLYEVNETFNDSLIFTEKPMYVAATKDSTNTFELSNLKAGEYLMVALKESSRDFTFQPKSDKIAFSKQHISIPTDSSFTLTLFKEATEYKIARPKHETKNHVLFGYEGKKDSLQIELLTKVPDDFDYRIYQDTKTDSLHYWFRPELEIDTLQFLAKHMGQTDTLTLKLRNLFRDSLNLSMYSDRTLRLKDTLKINANTPLISIDVEKISLLDKDSITVPIRVNVDPKYNLAEVIFDKAESQSYTLNALPGAFTDFYEATNDTLQFRTSTKAISDYGSLAINLSNPKSYPIIIELMDENYEVIERSYLTEDKTTLFESLTPAKYYVRITYDENKNGIWDTGSFLLGLQPEPIIYYPSLIEVRGNWDLVETFILD